MVENPQVGFVYVNLRYEEMGLTGPVVEVLELKSRTEQTVVVSDVNSHTEHVLSWSDLDDDPQAIIEDAYMDGFSRDTDGTVEYGSGHWIWEAFNGSWYGLQTSGTGNKWLYEYPSVGLWEEAKAEVRAEYDQLEAECPRHGGSWGEDETCEHCTYEDGSVRPIDDPGPLGPGAE